MDAQPKLREPVDYIDETPKRHNLLKKLGVTFAAFIILIVLAASLTSLEW